MLIPSLNVNIQDCLGSAEGLQILETKEYSNGFFKLCVDQLLNKVAQFGFHITESQTLMSPFRGVSIVSVFHTMKQTI